jgi:hypothetical protein
MGGFRGDGENDTGDEPGELAWAWCRAPFRATKAAVKMHTLLDLRGAIPSFMHVSDGKSMFSTCSSPKPAPFT